MKKELKISTYQLLIILFLIFNCNTSFSQSIDQNHTGTETNLLVCEETSVIAQSFTSGNNGLLSEISVDVFANFCPFNTSLDTIAFVSNIYDGSGTTGTLLTSQNVVMNLPYTRNLFPISFNNPALLIAGNQYTIELRINAGQVCDAQFGINIDFYWYSSASNDYPGGQPYSTLFNNLTNDLYFQTFMLSSNGIEENTAVNINIYPNPASEFLMINSSKNQCLQIEIYSSIGEKVISKRIEQSETIPINNLPDGMYFLKIISDNNSYKSKIIQVIK